VSFMGMMGECLDEAGTVSPESSEGRKGNRPSRITPPSLSSMSSGRDWGREGGGSGGVAAKAPRLLRGRGAVAAPAHALTLAVDSAAPAATSSVIATATPAVRKFQEAPEKRESEPISKSLPKRLQTPRLQQARPDPTRPNQGATTCGWQHRREVAGEAGLRQVQAVGGQVGEVEEAVEGAGQGGVGRRDGGGLEGVKVMDGDGEVREGHREVHHLEESAPPTQCARRPRKPRSQPSTVTEGFVRCRWSRYTRPGG
jgi:hypothetical protein